MGTALTKVTTYQYTMRRIVIPVSTILLFSSLISIIAALSLLYVTFLQQPPSFILISGRWADHRASIGLFPLPSQLPKTPSSRSLSYLQFASHDRTLLAHDWVVEHETWQTKGQKIYYFGTIYYQFMYPVYSLQRQPLYVDAIQCGASMIVHMPEQCMRKQCISSKNLDLLTFGMMLFTRQWPSFLPSTDQWQAVAVAARWVRGFQTASIKAPARQVISMDAKLFAIRLAIAKATATGCPNMSHCLAHA